MRMPRKDVLYRLFWQSWPALVAAVVWGITLYLSKEPADRSLATFVGAFASAFFFLGWLMTQYLRVEKQIDDSTQYEQLQAGIDDVKASIRDLHRQRVQDVKPPLNTSLMTEAIETVKSGRVLAGLLLAGVAFEQAVRDRALREGIEVLPRTPTQQLIRDLREYLRPEVIAELPPLWKLRNQLAHVNLDAAEELQQRPELLKHFEWAVGELSQPSSSNR